MWIVEACEEAAGEEQLMLKFDISLAFVGRAASCRAAQGNLNARPEGPIRQ